MPEAECDLLHEWLRRTAALMPEAHAIVEEERVTPFNELFKQAAALALLFVDHGIQKGDRIALVLPKSTDAIVCIFASLLAGAIYLPIHPQWPRERIEAVLEDSAARLVIECDGPLPRIRDCRTGAGIPWPALPTELPSMDRLPRIKASDAALILFTSGSTGRPKGVVLSHRAVSVFIRWTAQEFQITSHDRIACPSPLGFDLSTFDIFNMALCGALCVIVPVHIAWMPRFLAQFVSQARITCWYSVPSILSGLLQEGRFAKSEYPGLRLVLFAGEVFPGPGVVRLQAAIPQAVCVNLYGPTETNVVTWFRVPRGFDGSQTLPIGHACPYAQVTLDAASGELLAGGDSLMSGYWNRPQDTERSIVTLAGKQFYRTGDRVSLAPDGSYTFVGRLDRQVKRRGFRIELGEIEAALVRHEAILEAAVVAAVSRPRETVITAFVCVRAAETLDITAAKAHCARILPTYMVPDNFLFVNAISKGSRGKVDYLALERIAEGLNSGYQDRS